MSRMSCEQAVREFFAYLDRALAGEPLEALESHLQECLDCCDRLQFSRQLDGFVKVRMAGAAAAPDLEQRLRGRLAEALPSRGAAEEP